MSTAARIFAGANARHINLGFFALLATMLILATMTVAVAGDGAGVVGGTEFEPLYEMLSEWMTGYLGRIVAVTFIIIGLIAGAARGSVMGFALGVAAGIGMFMAPSVINGVVAATLPVALIG
jgi:conjugal transfer pilus assembly protein TraA